MDALFIIVGGGLSWILALGQLVRPKSVSSWIIFCWFFCVGYWQLYFGLVHSTVILEYPELYMTQMVPLLLTGPLTYLYFKIIHEKHPQITWRSLPHLIVPVFGILLTAPVWNLSHDDKLTEIMQYYETGVLPRNELALLTVVLIAAYLSYLIFKYFKISFRQDRYRNLTFYLSLLLIIWFIADGVVFLALLYESPEAAKAGSLIVSVSVFALYLFGQVFPQLLSTATLAQLDPKHGGSNNGNNRYNRSRLTNIDLDGLETQLNRLISEEKIFLQDDLNLQKLSDLVAVTPHQLSEFLNEKKKKNLNAWLNGYRVAYAKELLIREPQMTTLAIGLRVGFNSSSSFHAVFRREVGLSPGQYRKNKTDSRRTG